MKLHLFGFLNEDTLIYMCDSTGQGPTTTASCEELLYWDDPNPICEWVGPEVGSSTGHPTYPNSTCGYWYNTQFHCDCNLPSGFYEGYATTEWIDFSFGYIPMPRCITTSGYVFQFDGDGWQNPEWGIVEEDEYGIMWYTLADGDFCSIYIDETCGGECYWPGILPQYGAHHGCNLDPSFSPSGELIDPVWTWWALTETFIGSGIPSGMIQYMLPRRPLDPNIGQY